MKTRIIRKRDWFWGHEVYVPQYRCLWMWINCMGGYDTLDQAKETLDQWISHRKRNSNPTKTVVVHEKSD